MTHAYDKIFVHDAQNHLGDMLQTAVYDFGQDPTDFFNLFITSSYAHTFENASVRLLSGSNGIELAERVMLEHFPSFELPTICYSQATTPEFWVGWALAYYQWDKATTFRSVISKLPIQEILQMYHPFHEMDITQFCDEVDHRIAN